MMHGQKNIKLKKYIDVFQQNLGVLSMLVVSHVSGCHTGPQLFYEKVWFSVLIHFDNKPSSSFIKKRVTPLYVLGNGDNCEYAKQDVADSWQEVIFQIGV